MRILQQKNLGISRQTCNIIYTTMTMRFNPMFYLRHAWDATHSVWGKTCIVLFYVFIWLQILWALQILIAPTWGYECFRQGLTEYAEKTIVLYLRALNLFTIGFYLYADRGGIKVWNVAMVFIFNLGFTLMTLTMNTIADMEGGPKNCQSRVHSTMVFLWALVIWSTFSLLASFMETKSSDGSPSEQAPLL